MTAPGGMSPGAANVLAALLEARTGQLLATNRRWRLHTELRGLMAELALPSIDMLVGRLIERRDETLGDRIVDALLNRETSFFRDAGVIEAAAQALGEMKEGATARVGRRMRIWSAACATGQEPLSLAMLLAEAGGEMPEIVATDVSSGAIGRARSGLYSQFEIQRGLPVRRMVRWFEGPLDDRWRAAPALLRMVHYRRHNLVADAAPPGQFDLILCRNVLFYLAPAHRERVLDLLAGALRPGGLLLLGAGETLIGRSRRLCPSRQMRGFYEHVDQAASPLYMAR